ncbi:MAG: hypothetical protein ABID38_07015 [Candidatus Diapherotrites archaeon]
MPGKRKIKPGETFDYDKHRDRRKNPPKATGIFQKSSVEAPTYFFEKKIVGARAGAPYLGIRADAKTGKRSFLYGDGRDPEISYLYRKPKRRKTAAKKPKQQKN